MVNCHKLLFFLHTQELNILEYRINVQQILFKFWILTHLHAYFVINNSKEKRVGRICFLLPTHLFRLHVYLVL